MPETILCASSQQGCRERILSIVQSFEGVAGSLRPAERIREILPTFWGLLEECPPEAYQELGEAITSQFDKLINKRRTLRDGGDSSAIDREISDLLALKAEVLRDWPWDDRPLPPIDREMHAKMIAQSEAAIKRGEGIRLEDLIRELEGGHGKVSHPEND